MRLYNLKAANGWSNKGFSDLLQLLKEILPAPNQLPISTYEAKKIICKLGMNYEKISACPNDCVLYKIEYIDLNQCPQYGKSRWKLCADDTKEKHGVPAKVMWYLSSIPRFMRLFRNEEHTKNLTWHADGEGRICDRMMRHPADSAQWKYFDFMYEDFAEDPRNLRLGLYTDGFNPHSVQSS
ncbi:hypothetical protein AXF42_Ash003905 [Apostasia shenzhenica]|uniref:Uncharacterized protein n=1 Tax=Apostasia shenzhenica TaxID=1088818 RepID=A0A2I0AI96_9ASPA|nr:hypothetical protein AXF42_Ash003905 [Apostasia shenzhenica]